MFFRPGCRAGRKSLTSIPATKFHQPGNTITAADVSPLNSPRHVDGTRDRTSPADNHAQFRSGMNTHTVRLHITGDAYKIV